MIGCVEAGSSGEINLAVMFLVCIAEDLLLRYSYIAR